MVTELARQAVRIKCGFETARITGNYECAYAMGLISQDAGIEKQEHFNDLIELSKLIFDKINGYEPKSDKMKQLLIILKDYEITDIYDNQMKELYEMGYKDSLI